MSYFLVFLSFLSNLFGNAYANEPVQKYESSEGSYSLELPEEWVLTTDKEVIDEEGHTLLIDLWANQKTKLISLQVIVNPSATSPDLGEPGNEALKRVGDLIKKFKVEDSGSIILDGNEAMWHLVTIEEQVQIAKLQYVITANGRLYEITFTMPKAVFERYKDEVEKIVKSIRFVEP